MEKHTNVSTFEENTYSKRLENYILKLLTKGEIHEEKIFSVCGGAFPTEVTTSIRSLIKSSKILKKGSYYCLSINEQISQGNSVQKYRVPKVRNDTTSNEISLDSIADPHPADYDWRFTNETVEKIVARIDASAMEERVALLGTPTVYCRLGGERAILFEKNAGLLEDLRLLGHNEGLVQHDLFMPFERIPQQFGVIVADPPWYVDFYKAFLYRSSQIIAADGLLFLSVLPWLTRPSAVSDRMEILKFAFMCGYDIIEVSTQILDYETPKYESLVLERSGITCGDWRRGDLFIFRKISEPEDHISISPPPDEPDWDEIRLGKRKVKLKRGIYNDEARFSVEPVAEESIHLDTVSRRAEVRASIDLWTSDNKVYSVSKMGILRVALDLLSQGISLENIIEKIEEDEPLLLEEREKLFDLILEIS